MIKELRYKFILFKDRFINKWVIFLDYIRKLLMLSTFISMVVCFVALVYNTFVCYDLYRVITLSLFLFMAIHLNHSIQS